MHAQFDFPKLQPGQTSAVAPEVGTALLSSESQSSSGAQLDPAACFSIIDYLVNKGGPDVEDYTDLNGWADRLYEGWKRGLFADTFIQTVRQRFGKAFSEATLQGLALAKPRGYAGDFEIIDRIYTYHLAADPVLKKWDSFWQSHSAPAAVRNRKAYFHGLLDAHLARRTQISILNVASGPGRDVYEFLSRTPHGASFDFLEQDPEAIAYSQRLNIAFSASITHIQGNLFRWQPHRKYDLVWCSGLFDYFSAKLFCAGLRRLLRAVADGGEVVVGNFSLDNPSRSWMELSEWVLHHRSPEELRALAMEAGLDKSEIVIAQEPLGINLFLHVTPTPRSLATGTFRKL